jgi:hypothetical protein
VIILIAASCIAQADTFYTNQAAWAASVSGFATINFEGIAPAGGSVFYGSGPGASTNVGGVNFAIGPAGTDNTLFVQADGSQGWSPATVSVDTTNLGGAPNDLLITLPSAVKALAFDFGDFYGGTAAITLSDGQVQRLTSAATPNLGFFGVTAPGGLTSVDITTPNNQYVVVVSDFSYTTPEPSSLLLLGTGLVGFAGVVRRRLLR